MAKRTVKIGISARLYHPQPESVGLLGKTLQYLEQSVAHWVMSRDVLVFMVPSIVQDSPMQRSNMRLADYVGALDGLVLQGGTDLSPLSYGEEPLKPEWAGDRVRDAYEMELLHEFMEAGKPVLGICRGLQLINVALGGSLHQDIPSLVEDAIAHEAPEYDRHTHPVQFVEGGLLAKLYPEQTGAQVVSIHHQAVKVLGKDLTVEATAADGLVEAVRWNGRGFVVGLQWHPEFHTPGKGELLDGEPLLQAFLEEAKKRRW
jgi:putative glutamine amidotransferase